MAAHIPEGTLDGEQKKSQSVKRPFEPLFPLFFQKYRRGKEEERGCNYVICLTESSGRAHSHKMLY